MPHTDSNILINVLRNPSLMTGLSAYEWNECLREAKIAGLAGRLAADAIYLDIIEQLPLKVQNTFQSNTYKSQSSTRKIKWEINRVRRAMLGTDEKLILLKGGAYIAEGLKCTQGRVSVDLDVLVAKNRIDFAEEKFLAAGWEHQVENDYDQKYYREYAHELPPMVHPERYISIDVHHTILPMTSRVKPDIQKMIKDSVISLDGFYVFSKVDMLLHSVVHLFQDGEIRSSLRNLLEQHDMFTEFGQNETFWQSLVPRAVELGLTRSLYYSLHFTKLIFQTDIPENVMTEIAPYGPGALTMGLMNWMVPAVISPTLGAKGLNRWICQNGLYMRSHWLKMPPLLLVKHLTIKFFRNFTKKEETYSP